VSFHTEWHIEMCHTTKMLVQILTTSSYWGTHNTFPVIHYSSSRMLIHNNDANSFVPFFPIKPKSSDLTTQNPYTNLQANNSAACCSMLLAGNAVSRHKSIMLPSVFLVQAVAAKWPILSRAESLRWLLVTLVTNYSTNLCVLPPPPEPRVPKQQWIIFN
jgi:hypothetical protein